MSSHSKEFRLGLFILGGVALLVAGVIVLGVGALFTKTVPVDTVTLESVEGLDAGTPVKFRGVTVGKVAGVAILAEGMPAPTVAERIKAGNQIVVHMAWNRSFLHSGDVQEIRENFRKAAEAGARVRVTSAGLAGPPYIEVLFLDPKEYPPPHVIVNPDIPYIPSAPGQLSKLADDLAEIAASVRRAGVDKVVTHANDLLVSTNTAVNDLRTAELRQQLSGILDQVTASSTRLHEILDDPKISSIVAGVDETVNSEQIKALLSDLPKISEQARTSLARLQEILASPQVQKTLDNASQASGTAQASLVELRRSLRAVNEVLATEQQDLQEAVGDLRRVLENTASVTEDAKRNPSRVLFGQPPPHFKPGERPR